MGSITRGLSNNITTGGVILPAGITNASVSAVTSFANASGGTLILLSTQIASASATISFTTGLDSTYDEYQFKFINCHPSSNGARLTFNLSTDSGSNYNVTKTSTVFKASHKEDGASASLGYDTGADLAQSTGFQNLGTDLISDNDSNVSGILTLFNPSSTTYVKHFIATSNGMSDGSPPYSENRYIAGYGNTTSAVNAIQFKFDAGNIDDGIIKIYGVKKS
jgi:hypothetical protein